MTRQARAVRITDRDRMLLAFAAEHRFVQPAQVAALLGTSLYAAAVRLRKLSGTGVLAHKRWFQAHPPCYQITRAGLALVGSRLPPSRIDLRSYEHDVGVTWLWLAAHDGRFGPLREVLSERQLRSRDGAADGEPLAVRLGGVGPGGRERLHYPDLLLEARDGHRIAVELELSSKGRRRREGILVGYGADARIDAVLYLVESRAVGRTIGDSARRLGISDRVHVQRVRIAEPRLDSGAGMAAERARGTELVR